MPAVPLADFQSVMLAVPLADLRSVIAAMLPCKSVFLGYLRPLPANSAKKQNPVKCMAYEPDG
jgi:hypothetical protein